MSLRDRLFTAPKWLLLVYPVWAVAFLTSLARGIDTTWTLVALACVACADYLLLIWRAASDGNAGALVKILLAILSAIGTVFARSTAVSLVADALGADPEIAPNTVALLTVLCLPLCIGAVASGSLVVATLLPAAALMWEGLKHPEYLAAVLFAVVAVSSMIGFFAPLLQQKHAQEPGMWRLRLRVEIWRSLASARTYSIAVFALVGPLGILGMLKETPAHDAAVNLTKLLAVNMDFRSPGECGKQRAGEPTPGELTDAAIASIPNVDDQVLVARVREAGSIHGLLALLHPPGSESQILFARAHCDRSMATISTQNGSIPNAAPVHSP
jgi:hypothetical protein